MHRAHGALHLEAEIGHGQGHGAVRREPDDQVAAGHGLGGGAPARGLRGLAAAREREASGDSRPQVRQ